MTKFLDKQGLARFAAGIKAYIDERGGEAASIDFGSIDLPGKIEELIGGTVPSRMRVTTTVGKETYTIGLLEMFSDSSGHQITQVLTSNLVLKEGELAGEGTIDGTGHVDGKLYVYYRFYNRSMANAPEGMERGSWSKWKQGTDDFTRAILENVSSYVGSASQENKDLPSPVITGTFTVYNSDGKTQSSTSTASVLNLENGYQASWTGTFKWTRESGKKDPTSASGNWTALPKSGVASAAYSTPANVTSDTTIGVTLAAAKTGLMVSGTSVVLAKGNDTKTAQVKVNFLHRRRWGLTSEPSVTAAVVKSLSGTDLANSKTMHLTGISATDAQYYVIAYPKAMGELTKIVQNGATPLLNGGFVKSEVTVVNDAGASVAYLVYRTEKPGALKDSSFLDIA